jgi:hypothetical protein
MLKNLTVHNKASSCFVNQLFPPYHRTSLSQAPIVRLWHEEKLYQAENTPVVTKHHCVSNLLHLPAKRLFSSIEETLK